MTERDDLEFAKRIAEPLREPEAVEPDFEARLLTAVRATTERGNPARKPGHERRHSLGWLVAPRRVVVSPLAGLALAAGFATLVAAATLAMTGERDVRLAEERSREVVHFAIVAPAASTVTLVGDFNAWDTKTTPMSRGAVEGLWLVTVPLPAGSYQYAFVVDGTTWMADPAAPIALEDEFGTPSSIVTIRSGRT
jgi:hypothetical protein